MSGAKKAKTNKESETQENEALKKGLQAVLRDRLYSLYSKAMANGEVSLHERDNFINIYNQYHILGANGVMDEIKEDFMEIKLKGE